MSVIQWFKNLFAKKPSPAPAAPVAPKPVTSAPATTPKPAHAAGPRTSFDVATRLLEYQRDYDSAVLLPEWQGRAQARAQLAYKYKDRYAAIAKQASEGMPWYVVALLHMMESGIGQWDTYLGNGERIVGTGRKSSLVPAGRGPFATFEEGALDALKSERIRNVRLWDVPNLLNFAEGYNGWGYFKMKKRSPYLWSGTNLGVGTGKYTRDSFYDPLAVSQQIGVAAVLKALDVKL